MKNLLLVVVGVFAGLLPGCSSGNSAPALTLTSIAVTPLAPTVAAGLTQQFKAVGTYSNTSTQDLTATAVWASSSTAVATITSPGGLATALTVGTTTITATSGTVSGNTPLSVVAATLMSIGIPTPPPAGTVTIANGTSYALTALGFYNDGSKRNLTELVTWASSNTAVATIGATDGRAQGVGAGQATITATLGSVTANVTLNVTSATVKSMVVGPSSPTIALHTAQGFTAIGVFSDSSTQDITHDVTWTSGNTAVATVSNTAGSIGVATGVGFGTTTISAALEGVPGSVPLNVSSATLTSIAVTPASAGLAPGSILSLQAVGTFSDGTTQHIETLATWTSSATSVAKVNGNLVTGVSNGSATITCQLGSVSNTASLTVEAVTAIAISPGNASFAADTSTSLVATGTLVDGTSQNLTNSVQWTSSNASVATMSTVPGSVGVASGMAPGTTTVTAAFTGLVAVTQLTVTNATLSSITLKPAGPNSIPLGSPLQLVATGTFSDGTTESLTGQVTWSSSEITVAIIDDTGLVSTTGTGTTTIEAALGSTNDTTVVTVH